MRSAYFSKRALNTLNRFGDIMIPAHDEFPSFSEYGGLEHVDKLVAFAPTDDINDLNMVMGLLGFFPTFVLKFLVAFMATAQKRKGPLAPLLRQLNLGIRGIIFACYYAERPGKDFHGKDPVEIIDFEINRVVD